MCVFALTTVPSSLIRTIRMRVAHAGRYARTHAGEMVRSAQANGSSPARCSSYARTQARVRGPRSCTALGPRISLNDEPLVLKAS